MSTIGTLLESLESPSDELWDNDLHIIEDALAEVMLADATLTLRKAIAQLAKAESVEDADLWEGLLEAWEARAGQQPLEEAIGDRLRKGVRGLRKGARKIKNRYDRVKNSRRGRAVRRMAMRVGSAAKRAGDSATARTAGAAALSVFGI